MPDDETLSGAIPVARVRRGRLEPFHRQAAAWGGTGCHSMQSWTQWQSEIVDLLQRDIEETLRHLSLDDIDWPSWRAFYLQGRSPRAAVDRALERDL